MGQVKVLTAREAADLIKDGDTLTLSGFVANGIAEALNTAAEERFLETTRELIAFLDKSPTAFQAVDEIAAMLAENGFTHLHRAATLKDAVDQCRARAGEGWNVLLSPACASFDMFSDYEARGRIFKDMVNDLT